MTNQTAKKENLALLEPTLEEYAGVRGSLVTILQKTQEIYGYLPMDALQMISERTGVSPAKIMGVATFYENFSLDPKGKYVIKVCDGTACHVRKSVDVLSTLQMELGLDDEKNTTDDFLFTVEIVSCLGACGLAPVLTVNGKVHGSMNAAKTKELLEEIKAKAIEIESQVVAEAQV
ncbi:MAG: NAD(P)H-dependent oxidoreductase subunit E [Bacillota bacterium]|jgi:NADH-quinone oxidoreductase subunit E